jgi:hypothetical protein
LLKNSGMNPLSVHRKVNLKNERLGNALSP